LDYFRRIHADGACLSAGGCVASIQPGAVSLQEQISEGHGSFGEMVAGCRKLGMNVVARTDPHAIHQDAADAHQSGSPWDAEGHKAPALGCA